MARREVLGFWYDPSTRHFYANEDSAQPVNFFEFENLHNVSRVFYWRTQPLNPFYTPTKGTAEQVFNWVKNVVGNHVSGLRLQQEPIKSSPFAYWSHPEFSIYAASISPDKNGETDPLSVGLIASSLLRGNAVWLAKALEAELRAQGAWF